MKKQTMYNRLQKQYKKLNQSIQKAMETGRFYAYTQFKQEQLLSRLKRCSFQLKQLGAGVAVVAALGVATPAVGQGFIERTGVDNPFDGMHSTNFYRPSFVDIDDDGDLDMFRTSRSSSTGVQFFRNTGTSTTPLFTQITGINNPLNGVTELVYCSFVDIDNDGDLDMFGGEYLYGTEVLEYYENTGTSTTPLFTQKTGIDNPLDTIIADVTLLSGVNSAHPFFVDIDNDGDQDCFIGTSKYDSGNYITGVLFYENIGTALLPSFIPQLGVDNPLSGMTSSYSSGTSVLSIQFADMDQDGDQDAFLNGYLSGSFFKYYENTGTVSIPDFTLNSNTPLDAIPLVSDKMHIALVDIKSTGNKDVVENIQTQAHETKFYENLGVISISFIEEEVFFIYPNPTSGSLSFEQSISGRAKLYNISGQLVLDVELEDEQYLNIEFLNNGIYFLEIQTAEGRIREKVILQK